MPSDPTGICPPIFFKFEMIYIYQKVPPQQLGIDMAIYELGIIKNGILVFSKKYYDLDTAWSEQAGNDQNLRSQLISSIIHFANNCLSTEVEYFLMRKYHIAIASSQVVERDMKNFVVIYIIGDNDLGVEVAGESLNKLLTAFIDQYRDRFEIVEDTSKYDEFSSVLESILGDLHYRPLDRMRRLLST
jgi:hypothetical protein